MIITSWESEVSGSFGCNMGPINSLPWILRFVCSIIRDETTIELNTYHYPE